VMKVKDLQRTWRERNIDTAKVIFMNQACDTNKTSSAYSFLIMLSFTT
jgi:hypothetical protein